MRKLRSTLLRTGCALLLTLTLAPAVAQGPQRWDLGDLYPTPAAWDTAHAELRERVLALDALKDGLGAGGEALGRTLQTISDTRRVLGRLYVYASLKADEDLREPRAQERKQQAEQLFGLFGEKTAWLTPAIQALGAERVRALLAADPALRARFDLLLEDALRNLPHTLSPEGEALLAGTRVVLSQPDNLFNLLVDAELPRPTVRLSNGRTVRLSTDAYELHRQSAVRADRKRVFDGFFGALKQAEGTLGANLATQVMGDVFTAKARRFKGTLEAALFADNMPPAVYRTLIEQTRAGLPTLHRYLRLRHRMLGIQGPLAYHDSYPPLLPVPKGLRFDLESSKAITLQALAPLGDEYLGLLRRGLDARWTDSHPRPGKAAGAYMAGYAYDVHPYVLLNHNDDFESLSTLAHEWGHAVHTQLAVASQPFDKFDYATFIAESASITNEMLLSDFLVEQAKSREEKLYYLSQALESLRTTYFRQVLFAEFQLAINEEVEQGRPLSGARLSELYCGIARRYYGHDQGVMQIAPAYCVEWAYVGHFYSGYYVWQYATSMVGAARFSQALREEGAPARERFIGMLKAGGSDHPYALYVKAGVDLATPAPYQALFARMNRLMDAFESLAPPPRR